MGRILGIDPVSGLDVSVRNGRFGAYVQLGEQEEGSKTKPKRASLFKDMNEDEIVISKSTPCRCSAVSV